jgi:hypothetical protein
MNTTDLTKNVNRWAPEMAIMGVSGEKPMASKHDGFSSSSLATQVRESPSRPGVIWVGTDDGNLLVSQDGGQNFTNVYSNITAAPKGYVLVVRIEPSRFDPGTAFVALDNHRNDDWKPYLFKTTDFGKTWENVAGNLPAHGHINAFREDLENPRLLFAGTEFGLFVSMEAGKEWKKFMQGMPNVRVDDILIHPRDRDLIIGTHGRSIYIADDITPLEHYRVGSDKDVTLLDPRPAIQWRNDPQAQRHVTNRDFHAQNPQGGTAIHVWAKSDLGKGKLEFLQNNNVVASMDVDIKAGLNRFQWGMRGLPAANQGGGGRGRGNRGGAGGNTPPGEAGQAPTGSENAPAGQQPQAPITPTPTPATGLPPGGGAAGGRGGLPTGVPFVAAGGRGGGGGGGGGRGGFGFAPVGPLLDPGVYMIRLTVGSETLHSSVSVLEDVWMRAQ